MSVLVADKKRKTSKKTHGQLLRDLSDWHGGSIESFAKTVDYSPKSIYTFFNQEEIEQKVLIQICRKMDVPLEYFEGTYKLPLHHVMPKVPIDNKDTSEELNRLRMERIEMDRKFIEMQAEIIRLMKELQNRG